MMGYTDPAKKEAAAMKNRKRYHRRKYWIDKIKMSSGCVECGYAKNSAALDFNHIVPSEKEFLIPRFLGGGNLKRIFKEIRKCQILCANCHRIHSNDQWWNNITRKHKNSDGIQV